MEEVVFRLVEVHDIKQTDTILKISKHPPPSWEDVWESASQELQEISEDLEEEEKNHGPFYPRKEDLFRAFELCPLDAVEVVIFGQDPYDRPGLANGLSFSVKRGCAIPPSLNNIFKQIQKTVNGFRLPKHGDLTPWASQGVLLLNTCLTVRKGQPGSHKKVWMGFMRKVVKKICEVNPQCIFILWGRKADEISTVLHGNANILRATHPAERNGGFSRCNHFVEINEILVKNGKEPIDWQI